MNVGTKSLLFGVHQFLWHPWTVARAWRHIYKCWPTWEEWICIVLHDAGYWGKPDMDGAEGRRHPILGAKIAEALVFRLNKHVFRRSYTSSVVRGFAAYRLALYHSSHYAKLDDEITSRLYLPDKASILFEPRWWYLLRAKLSGEVHEYVGNSSLKNYPNAPHKVSLWYHWYLGKVKQKLEQHERGQ